MFTLTKCCWSYFLIRGVKPLYFPIFGIYQFTPTYPLINLWTLSAALGYFCCAYLPTATLLTYEPMNPQAISTTPAYLLINLWTFRLFLLQSGAVAAPPQLFPSSSHDDYDGWWQKIMIARTQSKSPCPVKHPSQMWPRPVKKLNLLYLFRERTFLVIFLWKLRPHSCDHFCWKITVLVVPCVSGD